MLMLAVGAEFAITSAEGAADGIGAVCGGCGHSDTVAFDKVAAVKCVRLYPQVSLTNHS